IVVPTVLRINLTSSSVAPPGPNPVDVLTKLAPASLLNSHALTFSSFVKRPVSIITLTIASESAASTNKAISDFTPSLLFTMRSPILMTISFSVALEAIATFVAATLMSVVNTSNGNPITVVMPTSLPSRIARAVLTQYGLIQIVLNLYSFASSHSIVISSSVLSGFNNV